MEGKLHIIVAKFPKIGEVMSKKDYGLKGQ